MALIQASIMEAIVGRYVHVEEEGSSKGHFGNTINYYTVSKLWLAGMAVE